MKKFCASFLMVIVCVLGGAQKPYFVDGYHGGIYGHYPVMWKTQFMVDQLEKYPEWRICLEIEPETWDTVRVKTPGAYENFRAIANDPRVEFTNPAYAQPYCYNISGESIIRQFAYGMRKIRSHFPEVEFVTYSVEEPCFTSSLPQILNGFGFRYAVLKCPNTCWGGYTAAYGGETVNWTGPDGSRILTVPRYGCEELEKNSVWQTTAWGNSREYLAACSAHGIEHPVGMCFQDAGWKGGPWIGSGNKIKNGSTYATWKEYMEQVADGESAPDYRMSQEDVRVSIMWGSQVLQQIARQVRRSENTIATAEKMAAIANICNGYIYDQHDMDEAWRTLMLAQHHDCWIVPYNRLDRQGNWARHVGRWTASTDALCDRIISSAQDSFTGGGVTGSSIGYVRVYNTLGVKRSEPVSILLPEGAAGGQAAVYNAADKKIESYTEVSDNKVRVVFMGEVPPFGYATYRITQEDTAGQNGREAVIVSAGECVIENDMYRIVLDVPGGGTIKSLIAKKEGNREFAVSGGEYAMGELRGYFYDEAKFRSSAETPARIIVLEDNTFEKSVLIEGSIASHPFSQTITLQRGQKRIDFDLRVEWQGNPGIGEFRQTDAYKNNRRAFYDDRFKLSVLFPSTVGNGVLYKNAPFDVCESRLEDTHFKTWDAIKHNVILNWVDVAEQGGGYGFALLSDHTTSYSYGEDFPLALTAQYSGNGLWGMDYTITGPMEIGFSVIPHKGDWTVGGIHNESLCRNEPLVCSFHHEVPLENRTLIDTAGTGYEISAAYPTDEGLVVRLFNAAGDGKPQKVKFGFPVSEVAETDLNGDITGGKDICRKRGSCEMEVSMPRFGLRTFLVSKEK